MDDIDTPPATAKELKMPEKTLAQWRATGIGPRYIKVGRHVRYRRSDVYEWLERQSRGGGAK